MTDSFLIKNSGFDTKSYYVPAFTIKTGEIGVIYIYNGGHFDKTLTELSQLFTGKAKIEHLQLSGNFHYVSHLIFKESLLKRWFFPLTVGKCLKWNKAPNHVILSRINELSHLTAKTKIQYLGAYERKLLSLNISLSKGDNIVFDLVGLGPESAQKVYAIVKELVKKGKTALLIDGYDEFQNDCDSFVTIEWKAGMPVFEKPVFKLKTS